MTRESDVIELDSEGMGAESGPAVGGIPRVDEGMAYSDFFATFLAANRPCVVRLSVSVEGWRSRTWQQRGRPAFSLLEKHYGPTQVPVADCGQKYYNVHKKSSTQLSEYLRYWKDYADKDYPSNMPCLYLKDWHFTRDFPMENVYRVPQYFASDWLNEYLTGVDGATDDYRFVYMGPKGSWTPLHADVFTSFSWSVNVCGRKHWLLFPPGQERHLCDQFGTLAYDATSPDLADKKQFPTYSELAESYNIIQEADEAIFVPCGWHHQVWNLEDTISINHNWINSCNVSSMWKSLQSNLTAVKKEVDDCQDMEEWPEHCQLMLKAVYGMDYEGFEAFLRTIGRKRLDDLIGNTTTVLFGGWTLGRNHTVFDLRKLRDVYACLMADPDTQALNWYKKLGSTPQDFISEINAVLLSTV